MDKKEATGFFNYWRHSSKKRKTDSMGWPGPYREDVINMIIDATKPKPQKKTSWIADKSSIKLTQCKACKQNIHFVETRKGRLMPCNPKKITIITVLGDVVSGWEAHFASCPQADKFRKGGR